MADGTCSIDGCETTGVKRRGMCEKHYKRWRRLQAEPPPLPSRRNACLADDCNDDVWGHGYCRLHYERWKRNGAPVLVQTPQDPSCRVDGCGRPSDYASLCNKHYSRKKATGDPERARRWPRDVEERLIEFIDRNGPTPRHMPGAAPCWIWTGATLKGYGRISANSEAVWTHRLMYERHVGPIPDGLEIDHLCLNPPCCNPAHLEPVTHEENARRMQFWRQMSTIFGGVMHADYGADSPTRAEAST